jgi:hypothetical protein
MKEERNKEIKKKRKELCQRIYFILGITVKIVIKFTKILTVCNFLLRDTVQLGTDI